MKKAFTFTAQIILSVIIAGIISLGVYALTKNETLAASTVAFGWILVALFMGAFDMDDDRKAKHQSIKDATRNYGQAAVFIGTACMFIGTPDECDKVADDMWHWGQQARIEMLSGEDTQFEIL